MKTLVLWRPHFAQKMGFYRRNARVGPLDRNEGGGGGVIQIRIFLREGVPEMASSPIKEEISSWREKAL